MCTLSLCTLLWHPKSSSVFFSFSAQKNSWMIQFIPCVVGRKRRKSFIDSVDTRRAKILWIPTYTMVALKDGACNLWHDMSCSRTRREENLCVVNLMCVKKEAAQCSQMTLQKGPKVPTIFHLRLHKIHTRFKNELKYKSHSWKIFPKKTRPIQDTFKKYLDTDTL